MIVTVIKHVIDGCERGAVALNVSVERLPVGAFAGVGVPGGVGSPTRNSDHSWWTTSTASRIQAFVSLSNVLTVVY